MLQTNFLNPDLGIYPFSCSPGQELGTVSCSKGPSSSQTMAGPAIHLNRAPLCLVLVPRTVLHKVAIGFNTLQMYWMQCTAVQCTELQCISLHWTALTCHALPWTLLCYFILYCTVWNCSKVFCTELHWTLLWGNLLFSTLLYYIALHCSANHPANSIVVHFLVISHLVLFCFSRFADLAILRMANTFQNIINSEILNNTSELSWDWGE